MPLPATIAGDDHRHVVVHLGLAHEGGDICEQVSQERLGAVDRAAGDGRLETLKAIHLALVIHRFHDTISLESRCARPWISLRKGLIPCIIHGGPCFNS